MAEFFAKGDKPDKEPIEVSISTDDGEVDIYFNGDLVATVVDDALELYCCSSKTALEDYPELFQHHGFLNVRQAGQCNLLK